MKILFDIAFTIAVMEILLALLATFAHRMGPTGREVIDACTRAPLLDLVVGVFTWIPWLITGLIFGWRGVVGSLLGQAITLQTWVYLHEFLHRDAVAGPRIVKALNGIVGRWRNHLALWVSLIALPGFLVIRLYHFTAYPMLCWILGFPKYNQGEWVNVSRQKFNGLVGHDLIWCLYCDWMTGVYSLGAEMLRNVESFWCPIRFYDGKKCDNCKLDFPDLNNGWVSETGTMTQVAEKLQTMYGDGQREWFGHPVRLTIRGK